MRDRWIGTLREAEVGSGGLWGWVCDLSGDGNAIRPGCTGISTLAAAWHVAFENVTTGGN